MDGLYAATMARCSILEFFSAVAVFEFGSARNAAAMLNSRVARNDDGSLRVFPALIFPEMRGQLACSFVRNREDTNFRLTMSDKRGTSGLEDVLGGSVDFINFQNFTLCADCGCQTRELLSVHLTT